MGEVPRRATGWSCPVWWTDEPPVRPGETREVWAAGAFVGRYPCRDRTCVIAGASDTILRPSQPAGLLQRLRAHLETVGAPPGGTLGDLAAASASPYVWPMVDVRAPSWVRGRVVLVGDAAAGFLPTAGIGASMALESAAVLADELSRTDTRYLPNALQLYVRRRQRRVEAAQTQSRRLAWLMFLRSLALTAFRNRALQQLRITDLVGPLIKDLRRPI